jgi:hypothetical protein
VVGTSSEKSSSKFDLSTEAKFGQSIFFISMKEDDSSELDILLDSGKGRIKPIKTFNKEQCKGQ